MYRLKGDENKDVLVSKFGEVSEWLKELAWQGTGSASPVSNASGKSVYRLKGDENKDVLVSKFGEVSEWLKELAWKACIR